MSYVVASVGDKPVNPEHQMNDLGPELIENGFYKEGKKFGEWLDLKIVVCGSGVALVKVN